MFILIFNKKLGEFNMGGRGALSTTGRRAVGTAAISVFGRGIKRTTRSFFDNKIFAEGEKSINSFVKKVSEQYGDKKGGKLVRRNEGLQAMVGEVARGQNDALTSFYKANNAIHTLRDNRGKGKPENYISKEQKNLDAAKARAKSAQERLSTYSKYIPDAVKVQINPTAGKEFKRNVNLIQGYINEQKKKYGK